MVEQTGLEVGMSLASHLQYRRIRIVGDLCLIIDMVQRIINDSPPQKVVKIWRLESQLSRIHHALTQFEYINTIHVLKKGNKVAYWLANCGANPLHNFFRVA